jgi:broad specificity phosphatase PhoE
VQPIIRLTLIRHGPTEWNASRRFQGRSDLPLSDEGRVDARKIAAALRDEPIDAIYSSDLSRALETARFVAESRDIPILTDQRLREFDFGSWEGLTWAEIVATNPEVAGPDPTAASLYAPEGGESFEQVGERVRSFLDDTRRQHPNESIVVVTHAGPLHAAFSILGLSESQTPEEKLTLSFTPGSITRVVIEDDHPRLLQVNDVRHLDPAG